MPVGGPYGAEKRLWILLFNQFWASYIMEVHSSGNPIAMAEGLGMAHYLNDHPGSLYSS